MILKAFKYLLETNWVKTIRINFHYFPFKQAIRFPILVAHRTVFQQLGGAKLECPATPGMLLIGYRSMGTQDPFYDRTIWQVSGNIVLKGRRASIGRGSKICVSGTCSFGNHFLITGQSSIICHKLIDFGNDVLLSWDVLLMDTDYHKILDIEGKVINEDDAITVGDDVWIGCRSTILKGTIIPSNSIVAAGSVIAGRMDKENCIYSSNRKVIRENIKWER